MRHLIDFGDMSRAEWDELYARASRIMDDPSQFIDTCRGKVAASLFYEPSTRTNFSFQTAMLRLGGTVFGFADPNSSSVAKGETLKDTIKMVSSYADVVVMRTPWEGAAKAASLYSHVPVVNAGDGGHMHPTQTMADLTTMTRLLGKVDGLSIGLCGDLKNGRTVHSLIKAMAKFRDVRFFLISPRELAVPEYMRAFLQENGMPYTEVTGLEAVIPQLDVLYMTRIQRERFVDPLEYERNKGIYILTRRKLERAKEHMLVMHPLPRVDEIAVDVDDDPRAVYFQQARYGMFARMALLADLANQPRLERTAPVEIGTRPVCSNPRCITQTQPYLPPLVKQNGGVDCCAFCDAALRWTVPLDRGWKFWYHSNLRGPRPQRGKEGAFHPWIPTAATVPPTITRYGQCVRMNKAWSVPPELPGG